MNLVVLVALSLVVAAALLMVLFAILRRKSPSAFRKIAAYQSLNQAVGQAVEGGSRLHVSLGSTSLASQQAASGLAGLAALLRLGNIAAGSDLPPMATSGDPGLTVLSKDILQSAHQGSSVAGQFDPARARLTGLTPFSYAAGGMMAESDEEVSANLLLGSFGAEAGLLVEASERQHAMLLGASDSLPGQAVLLAGSQQPLVGEELFAAPEYLRHQGMHSASLGVQDVLRWLLIAGMLLGAVLKLAGVL